MSRAGIFASAHVESGGGGGLTFQQYAFIEVSTTTFTFEDQPIGPAAISRRVVVGVTARQGSYSGVTIGGVAANQDAYIGGIFPRVAIYSAVVPTGSTADVVVSFSSSTARCVIGVWTLEGDLIAADAQKAGSESSTTGVVSASVSVNSGDRVVAMYGCRNPSGVDWTGATEQFETAGMSSTLSHGSGADLTAATTGTLGVTATGGSERALAVAAYR